MVLPVGGPELKSEKATDTGLNCHNDRLEKTLRQPVAEGEELGSNLLRVAHSSRGYSGGPDAFDGAVGPAGGAACPPVWAATGLPKAVQPSARGRPSGASRWCRRARAVGRLLPKPALPSGWNLGPPLTFCGDAAIQSLSERSGHSASRAYRTGFMSTCP